MTNGEAKTKLLAMSEVARKMADHLAHHGDYIDDVYLAELMGTLHNTGQELETWLFGRMTTKEPAS